MYFTAYYTATMFNIPQILNLYLFWDGNAGSFFPLSYQFAARRLKQLATKRESQVFKTVEMDSYPVTSVVDESYNVPSSHCACQYCLCSA